MGAYPFLEMVGADAPSQLLGKVFAMQFDATGQPVGQYMTADGFYELVFQQARYNYWTVRVLANGVRIPTCALVPASHYTPLFFDSPRVTPPF